MSESHINSANPEAFFSRPPVDSIDPSRMVYDASSGHGLTTPNPKGEYDSHIDRHHYDAVYYGPTWRYGRNGFGMSVYANKGDTFDATLEHLHAEVTNGNSSIAVDSHDQRVDMNGADYVIDEKDEIILRMTTPGGKKIVDRLTKILGQNGENYQPQWRRTKRVGGEVIVRDEPLTPRQVRALGRLTARKFGLSYTEDHLRTPGPLRLIEGAESSNYEPHVYAYVNQLVRDGRQEGLSGLDLRKKLLTTLHPDRNLGVEGIEDYFSYASSINLGQRQVAQEFLGEEVA